MSADGVGPQLTAPFGGLNSHVGSKCLATWGKHMGGKIAYFGRTPDYGPLIPSGDLRVLKRGVAKSDVVFSFRGWTHSGSLRRGPLDMEMRGLKNATPWSTLTGNRKTFGALERKGAGAGLKGLQFEEPGGRLLHQRLAEAGAGPRTGATGRALRSVWMLPDVF